MNEKASVQGYDISAKSAAVIGCGGLGTNAAVHLVGAGIGRIWLCDFDTVQTRNLNRQFFYTPEDLDKPKCALLAERLQAYAPETAVIPVEEKISCQNDLSFADQADLVILAVDNIQARRIVNDYCKAKQKPLVNGGVDRAYGTAYLYVPGANADLEAAGLLQEPVRKPQSQSPVVGVIGALEAKLAVDYFLGKTETQGKLLCFDGMEITALHIHSNKGDEAT